MKNALIDRLKSVVVTFLLMLVSLALLYGLVEWRFGGGHGHGLFMQSLDAMARADFKAAVMREDAHRPSSDLHILYYTEEMREKSYTRGFWTPRAVVAEGILRAVEAGARVVVSLFHFGAETPVLYLPDPATPGVAGPYSDDDKCLALLREAAKKAQKMGP